MSAAPMEPCTLATHTGCLTAECTVLRAEWLAAVERDLPIGRRVRVNARTDVRDYEGARGTVIGYEMQTMETPLVRVLFDGDGLLAEAHTGGKVVRVYRDGFYSDELEAI